LKKIVRTISYFFYYCFARHLPCTGLPYSFGAGHIPVIAGGLIETKTEVFDALGCGATAVSTGRKNLWYL